MDFRNKLTLNQREKIICAHNDGIAQTQLAEDYNVSVTTIRNIITRPKEFSMEKWNKEAKRVELQIASKYNTPSGRKR